MNAWERKTYKITVSPAARVDILDAASYIQQTRSELESLRWKNALTRAIRSLEEMPHRCPKAAESDDIGLEIRALTHHPHRILFRVAEDRKTVEIMCVYHEKREPLTPENIME